MGANWSSGRRLAVTVIVCLWVAVLVITAFVGLAPTQPIRAIQISALVFGVFALLLFAAAATILRLARYRNPSDEDAFEQLVRDSENLAIEGIAAEPYESEFMELDPRDPNDFDQLVREALDDLPDLLIKALDHVAVVISDKGHKHKAYGLYQGDTFARDNYPDRIIIFRDTLLRDFGRDPDALRDQVTRTVRHELAHHLGADELGVSELGL